jgi:phage shock protein PspC (stress-responsive transcriptional regulator)
MIAGVAAGLADYLDVDVAVVRVGLVVLALVGALGLPLYLAAWLFVPDECDDESIAERFLGHGFAGPARGAGVGASATQMASAPHHAGAPSATSPVPEPTMPSTPPGGPGPDPRSSDDGAPS